MASLISPAEMAAHEEGVTDAERREQLVAFLEVAIHWTGQDRDFRDVARLLRTLARSVDP